MGKLLNFTEANEYLGLSKGYLEKNWREYNALYGLKVVRLKPGSPKSPIRVEREQLNKLVDRLRRESQ